MGPSEDDGWRLSQSGGRPTLAWVVSPYPVTCHRRITLRRLHGTDKRGKRAAYHGRRPLMSGVWPSASRSSKVCARPAFQAAAPGPRVPRRPADRPLRRPASTTATLEFFARKSAPHEKQEARSSQTHDRPRILCESGLLDDSDIADASSAIEPGSSAGILIFENRWATPFTQALRRGGGQLVAAGYIPQDSIVASLDATDH